MQATTMQATTMQAYDDAAPGTMLAGRSGGGVGRPRREEEPHG